MSQSETTPPRGRRWMRIVLLLSLTLNVLVIGMAIGAVMRFGDGPGGHRPPPSFGAALYRELPRADRRAVRDAMQSGARAGRSDRKAEARQLADALRAAPFDELRVQTALEAQSQNRLRWQSAVQAAWLAQVSEMGDTDRKAYADRLEEALTRPRKAPRKHDKQGN